MGTATPSSTAIRVLLVDDDQMVLRTLRELLSVYQFEVDIASSGSEALDILGTTDPDCILMDIVMPEKSGVDVFRDLKPLKPTTPVIFMTGYAHSEMVEEALHEGAVDVIAKPIDMKQLVALINKIAER